MNGESKMLENSIIEPLKIITVVTGLRKMASYSTKGKKVTLLNYPYSIR
jgi:hypothetical protein